MKEKTAERLKRLKVLWDTYKMAVGLVALLGSLGAGSWYAYDEAEKKPDPIVKREPVKVDELIITHINPDHALKVHNHPELMSELRRMFEEYSRSHDPQKLGH